MRAVHATGRSAISVIAKRGLSMAHSTGPVRESAMETSTRLVHRRWADRNRYKRTNFTSLLPAHSGLRGLGDVDKKLVHDVLSVLPRAA